MTAVSPRPRARRLGLLAGGAALLGLVAALLSPLSAQAVPVTLAGTVVGPTGSAAGALSVKLVATPGGAEVASATTTSTGAFTFATVDPGTYTLRFAATTATFAQYLGGTTAVGDATELDLSSEGGKTTYVKAQLSASGTLSGTVTRYGSSTVIPGATVTVYAVSPTGAFSVATTATASSTGAYVVRSLPPGPYRLSAQKLPAYPAGFNGDALLLSEADDVAVSPGKTTTVPLKIGAAGRISGVVRANGTPLAGVTIRGFRSSDNGTYSRSPITATTSATGAYTISGLAPGDWVLYADSPDGSGVGSEFYGDSDSILNAERLELESGTVLTGKNFDLGDGFDVQGTVRASGSLTGLQRVRVSLTGSSDDVDIEGPTAVTWTDADGYYLFPDIAPGEYVLTFGAFEASPLEPSEDTTRARSTSGSFSVTTGIATIDTVLDLRQSPDPTSGPEVTGSGGGAAVLEVGERLEASYGSIASSGYAISGGYQWYRDGAPIAGATDYFYIAQPADVGHSISVLLYRDDWSWGHLEWLSPAVGPIAAGQAPTVYDRSPAIAGDSRVGEVLTVDTGTWETVNNYGQSDHVEPTIAWEIQWERSTDNSTYTPLEVGVDHAVTIEDLTSGPYLRATLTGSVAGFAPVTYTTLPRYVDENTFTVVTAPRVTASSTMYTVQPGTYSPSPTGFDYVWHVYDATATEIATLSGASIAKSAVAGRFVYVEVTPTRDGVNGSPRTLTVQQGPKIAAFGSTAITGTPRVGEILSAPAPTLTPVPDATTYAWQYFTGKVWKAIPGVSSAASTYLVAPTYRGMKLRVLVTVSKPGYGTTTLTSPATGAVATGLASVPTVAPALSGAPAANAAISVTTGTWTPAATAITYQWRSGTTATGPWSAIAGARSATFTPPASLEGRYLSVVVSAARTGHATGSTEVIAPTPVAVGALRNVTKPTAKPGSGGTLVASGDTWTPAADSSSYEFVRLNENGSETTFAGSTFSPSVNAPTQPIDLVARGEKSGWVDGEVRVAVRNGTLQPTTTATLPAVPKAGEMLGVVEPILAVTPAGTSYAYQWQRYTAASGWRNIAGATTAGYQPVGGDAGKQIRVIVTVSAPRYTSISRTSAGAVVQTGDALTPTSSPLIFGTPRVASSPIVKTGTWSAPGATFSYQWQSASAAIGPFTAIAGATSGTFKIPEALYGQYLRVAVTAKATGFATGSVTTAAVQVQQGQMAGVKVPTVSKSGSVLTATAGTWNVTPTEVHYSWYRVSTDIPVTSEAIGTDSPSYTLTPDDAGRVLRVVVTASRGSSWIGATQEIIAQRGAALVPLGGAGAGGSPEIGQTLGAYSGGWNAEPTSSTFQWRRNGVAIPGATGASYLLVAADLGARISVSVVAMRDGHPSYSATLPVLGIVTSPNAPTLVTAPTIVGPSASLRVGDTATANPGGWLAPGLSTAAGVTFAYQWLRDGVEIGGARASTYLLTPDDANHELRVVVTARKTNYAATTVSSASRTVLPGTAATFTPGALTIALASGSYRPSTVAWSLAGTERYEWVGTTGVTESVRGTDRVLPAGAVASGDTLYLRITWTRPGYTTSVVTSGVITIP